VAAIPDDTKDHPAHVGYRLTLPRYLPRRAITTMWPVWLNYRRKWWCQPNECRNRIDTLNDSRPVLYRDINAVSRWQAGIRIRLTNLWQEK